MTTLLEARAALLKLQVDPSNKQGSAFREYVATLSNYLDNMVPLNVENNNLMQRLALAEGFVATIRDQSVMAAARFNLKPATSGHHDPRYNTFPSHIDRNGVGTLNGVKLAQDEVRPQEQNEQCVAHHWRNLKSPPVYHCAACRVRANA